MINNIYYLEAASQNPVGCQISVDLFGDSVSMDGDRFAAGAPGNDDDGRDSGSAYVFERQGDRDWQEVAKLTASDAGTAHNFGQSISLSGDRLIVGAPGNTENGARLGAAYVFERQAEGSRQEVAKLTASDAATEDAFGDSVSMSGDRLVVGARFDADAGFATGAAYVFERQGDGSWQEVAKLTASDAASGDFFARSVSLSGDHVVVGYPSDDDDGQGLGSVYVFERQGDGSWQEVAKLTASDASFGDTFGQHIALNGNRVIIGAPNNDDDGLSSGSAYVFERQSDGSWKEVAKLTALDAQQFESFGRSVSLDGNRIAIGTSGIETLDLSGSAYVFERQDDGSWLEVVKLTASDAAIGDEFGFRLSVSGDRLVIGAPRANIVGRDSGAVYVFGPPTPPPDSPCDCANATIAGTTGNDKLIGTVGDDIICGFGGDDRIFGEGGNDCLDGGNGNDRIFGGSGSDLLLGRQGNDHLHGEADNDVLNGHVDDDVLSGGAGDDLLLGAGGNDDLLGDVGEDVLNGGNGDDILRGGSGNDTLQGANGNDFLRGDDGDDDLRGGTGDDIVDGDGGNDDLRGGSDNDIVKGDAGDDFLAGNGGNDMLCGGSGDDDLSGNGENDSLRGDSGNDVLRGGSGDDDLRGGSDNDVLRGDSGNDTLQGSAGIDLCRGGSGIDTAATCEEVTSIP